MAKTRRSTLIKKQIIDLLTEHHLLSATQILEKLHTAGVTANKTSVYRNLESFLEDDLICQQAFDGEFLYELKHDHHDHIHCYECGKVEEVSCQLPTMKSLQGYSIVHHHVTLYGICKDCQKAS